MVPSCRWQLWELPKPVMTENPMTRSLICLSDFEEPNDPWIARNKRLICKVQPWVCEAFLCTQFQAQLVQHYTAEKLQLIFQLLNLGPDPNLSEVNGHLSTDSNGLQTGIFVPNTASKQSWEKVLWVVSLLSSFRKKNLSVRHGFARVSVWMCIQIIYKQENTFS